MSAARLLPAIVLLLVASPAHAADTRRLDVRTQGGSLRLQAHATSTGRATGVEVRGSARIRTRGITLALVRCRDARCRRPRRSPRASRGLRRGLHPVRARWRTAPSPFVRVEVHAGRRRVGGVTLRPAPGAAGAPGTPAPPVVSDSGPAALELATVPPLRPAFDPATPDYTVECEPSGPVRVNAVVPAEWTLALDGAATRSGRVAEDVALRAGQAFRFSVEGPRGARRTHSVRCVPEGFPTWKVQRDGVPQVGWLVFNASRDQARYAVIADARGVPVWWKRVVSPSLVDTQLLPDGTVAIGRGSGTSFSQTSFDHLRLDGTDLGSLSTAGIGADPHDIQLLPSGNHLLMAYVPREHVDLSSIGGPADATVLDGELQEVTPQGRLVWSWNSADHIDLAEAAPWGAAGMLVSYEGRPAYDLVHLNSAEQTGDAVLVSARHLHAVYSIRRGDGGIDFKLGGTPRAESLELAADPFGSASFGGQHDARLLSDGTLTLHDNGFQRARPPRALRYELDPIARTATLVEQVTDPRAPQPRCCGSARRMPGGHWVMSWGGTPLITELTAAGEPVLTLTLEDRFSYRVQPLAPERVLGAALRDGMDVMHPRP